MRAVGSAAGARAGASRPSCAPVAGGAAAAAASAPVAGAATAGPLSSSSSSLQGLSTRQLLARPSRRRGPPRANAQATQMLIELGLAAAAAWVAARPQTDPRRGGDRDCATCGGTGKEECACRRWSDTDIGCGTCEGTGYSPCRSCGGGGTAVPIALTERKLAPEDIRRLQEQQERDRRDRVRR